MGRLFCAKGLRKRSRAVCLSFHFERIYIPDSFDGTPESAYQEALQKKQAYDEEEQKLKKQLHDTLEKHAGKIAGACAALEHTATILMCVSLQSARHPEESRESRPNTTFYMDG